MMYQEKFERQKKLETLMVSRGRERYESNVRKAQEIGAEDKTKYGVKIISKAILEVSKLLDEWLQEAQEKPGKRHVATAYLQDVDSKVAAYIALSVCCENISRATPFEDAMLTIGNYIELELRNKELKEADRERYKVTQNHFKHTPQIYKRKITLTYALRQVKEDYLQIPKRHKLGIGHVLFYCLRKATGLFEIETRRFGKKERRYLKPTQKTLSWIAQTNEHMACFSPSFLPCVIPPKHWSNPFNGGYHTNQIKPLSLVKTPITAYLEELENRPTAMSTTYAAVNAMQDTAWRINTKVLDVALYFWEIGNGSAGLPTREEPEHPLCPVCGGIVENNHACFKNGKNSEKLVYWKKEMRKYYNSLTVLYSKRFQTAEILHIAQLFRNEKAIYFPYQLDFRGRAYAVPVFLNPQGCALAKSLLEFAEGMPIDTPEAEEWFYIHGANLFGEDKISFSERCQWVEKNHDKIIASASNPLDNRWWCSADDPFSFLAWCFEYKGYKEQGANFLSHCCISMDGSCNGLQHFSAMLRDEIGGKSVNLVPQEKPADIYSDVAEKVREKVEKIYNDPNINPEEKRLAKQWLDWGITRKITKRAVMIVPYSGTEMAAREYILDAIYEQDEALAQAALDGIDIENKQIPWKTAYEKWDAKNFIAPLVWEAINETVIAARAAMDWLQKVAKLASEEGLPIVWETPTGFPVLQAYPNTRSRRVKTCVREETLYFYLQERPNEITKDIDKIRQKNAIAPNLIHSLDASVMMLTIEACKAKGINSFGMIHDSYGTHAKMASDMAKILRQVFISLYESHDILSEFEGFIKDILPKDRHQDIPAKPSKGNLDLNLIQQSKYFFA